VIILVSEVKYFSFGRVNPEGQASVVRDREAPGTLAVAGEPVHVPARNIPELAGVFHLLQEGHDVADLLDDSGRKAGSIVTLDESPQAPMEDIPDSHWAVIAGMAFPVKLSFTGVSHNAEILAGFERVMPSPRGIVLLPLQSWPRHPFP
jgi:hypothetical protein